MSFITTKTKSLSKLACAVTFALCSTSASAIVIQSHQDAQTLSNSLIIPGSGVTVTSTSLTGGTFFDGGSDGECPIDIDCEIPCPEEECGPFPGPLLLATQASALAVEPGFTSGQAGTFTNASGVYGLPSEGGIVLSSGFVSDYEDGPNTEDGFSGGDSTSATIEQNELLSTISGELIHFDPIQLDITFDVDEDVSTISFIAAFGSEEYPDYVDSDVTDAFGMFLNGELVAGVQPTDPANGTDLLPVNIDHPDFAPVEGTELNGMLAPNGVPLLRFDIPVEPGSIGNSFTIIIADASDSVFDSTVFLSSFGNFDDDGGTSEFTPILPDPSNPTNDEGAFVFNLPEIEEGETIWIDPDVATGYVYETDGVFSSVTAPTLLTVNDSDGYMLHFTDSNGAQSVLLTAGQEYIFAEGVSMFTIDGIDPTLGLDPTDGAAFTLGVSFSQVGQFVTQDPITTFVDDGSTSVPEPTSIVLFGLSLVGLSTLRRKK